MRLVRQNPPGGAKKPGLQAGRDQSFVVPDTTHPTRIANWRLQPPACPPGIDDSHHDTTMTATKLLSAPPQE
ncbi:MAG TPA: hypothetical protein VF332_04575 [Vicinamibacterales bacterium]